MGACRRCHTLLGYIAISLVVMNITGCPDVPPTPDPIPPTAEFTASPLATVPGTNVAFTDRSDAGSHAIGSWVWQFGDGETSNEQHPTHQYREAGLHTVSLTVASTAGEDTITKPGFISITTEPDVSRPEITLNGAAVVTLECGIDPWSDPGATASDDHDPEVEVTAGGDSVDEHGLGTYTITYDATDRAGNHAVQAVRTVNVVDTMPPSVRLDGTDMDVELGSPFVDPGAQAIDACAGELEVSVDRSQLQLDSAGVYPIVYTAVDASGNAAHAQRLVNIFTACAPVVPWSRIHGEIYGEPRDYRVLQTHDCGYLLVGVHVNGIGDNSLIKLAVDGSVEWYEEYPTEEGDVADGRKWFVDAIELPNGNFLILGHFDDWWETSHLILYEVSSIGTVLKERVFDEQVFFEPVDIVQAAQDRYYILGNNRPPRVTGRTVQVLELDANWNVVNAVDVTRGWGVSMQRQGDSLFVAANHFTFTSEAPGVPDIERTITKLSQAGEIAWVLELEEFSAQKIVSLCVSSDGGGAVILDNDMPPDVEPSRLVAFHAGGETKWTYPGEADEKFGVVSASADGGFILAGRRIYPEVRDEKNLTNVVLRKLNAAGQEVWQREYGGENWESEASILPLRGGGYFFLGYTNSFHEDCAPVSADHCYDLYLMRLDPEGVAPLEAEHTDRFGWIASYEHEVDARGTAIVAAHEGGYVGIGAVGDWLGGVTERNVIFSVSEKGALRWARTISLGVDFALHELIATSDGGYAAGGYTNEWRDRFVVIKFDSEGNQEWLCHPFDGPALEAKNLLELSDHSIVAVGDGYHPANGAATRHLIRLSADGEALAELTFPLDPKPTFHAIALAKENGLWILSSIYDGVPEYKTVLTRTDSYGTVLWEKTYTQHGSNRLTSFAPLEDGGLILSGTAGAHQDAQGWVVRTDWNGDIVWEKFVKTASTRGAIHPIDNSTFLLSTGYNSYWGRLAVIDLMGNVLWERVETRVGIPNLGSAVVDDGIVCIGTIERDDKQHIGIFKADMRGRLERGVAAYSLVSN